VAVLPFFNKVEDTRFLLPLFLSNSDNNLRFPQNPKENTVHALKNLCTIYDGSFIEQIETNADLNRQDFFVGRTLRNSWGQLHYCSHLFSFPYIHNLSLCSTHSLWLCSPFPWRQLILPHSIGIGLKHVICISHSDVRRCDMNRRLQMALFSLIGFCAFLSSASEGHESNSCQRKVREMKSRLGLKHSLKPHLVKFSLEGLISHQPAFIGIWKKWLW
jgi:hypothetical protein